jgi:hypothetical protein
MLTKDEITSSLRSYVEERIPAIKQDVIDNKEIVPEAHLVFCKEKTTKFFRIPRAEVFFQSPAGKDKFRYFMKDLIEQVRNGKLRGMQLDYGELVAIVIISDVYWVRREKEEHDEKKDIPPSQDPNRIEAIMFNCQQEGLTFMQNYPYERKEEGIIFDEPDYLEGGTGEGRFADLFT